MTQRDSGSKQKRSALRSPDSRRPLFLLVGGAILAVSIGGVAFISSPTPEPEPQFEFSTEKLTYRLGENVTFVLSNHGPLSFCYLNTGPWAVSRFVNGMWEPVESHAGLDVIRLLGPGSTFRGAWIAEDDPFREGWGLAEVVPGEYRMSFEGYLCRNLDDLPVDPASSLLDLFAYFELVARAS